MRAGPVRREELDVETLAAYWARQLDLHVAATREPELDRARDLPAAQVVLEVGRGEVHELAATQCRSHCRLGRVEIGDHERLLEKPVADLGEQPFDHTAILA